MVKTKSPSIFVLVVFIFVTISVQGVYAWFGEGYLFSNLQWTPDGENLVWESRFESGSDEGISRDLTSKILTYNLTSGELRNLTPDVTSIEILPGGTILLSGLYGVCHIVDDDEIKPLIFKPTFYNEKTPKVLNMDWDKGLMIYGLLALQIGEVYKRELSTGDEEMLVDKVSLVKYLRDSNRLIYTSEVVMSDEEQINNGDEKLMMYDLETAETQVIFAEHRILSMEIAPNESRLFLLTEGEMKKDKGSFPKPKPKKIIQSVSITDNKSASEILFEGFLDSISKDELILLSPDGGNILFSWYEDVNGDGFIVAGKDLLHISTIDVNTGGIINLPYDEMNNPVWSPNGNCIAFWCRNDERGDYYICIYDVLKEGELFRKNVSLKGSYENDAVMGLQEFAWSPNSDYIAYTSGIERIGAEGLKYTSNPTLNVIDVRDGSYLSFEGIGGYNLVWRDDSQLLYSNGPHLFCYDFVSGEDRLLSTGNGYDLHFDDEGGLVYLVKFLPEGYSKYWRLDMSKWHIIPYLDDVAFKSEEMAKKEEMISIISPDGKKIAVCEGGRLTICDQDGTNPILLVEEGVRDLEWSPKGDKLAWIREGIINNVYPYTDIWIANSDGSGVTMAVKKMTNY